MPAPVACSCAPWPLPAAPFAAIVLPFPGPNSFPLNLGGADIAPQSSEPTYPVSLLCLTHSALLGAA